nr:hypothetical protein pJBCL41_00309 [Pseudomonas sp.]
MVSLRTLPLREDGLPTQPHAETPDAQLACSRAPYPTQPSRVPKFCIKPRGLARGSSEPT